MRCPNVICQSPETLTLNTGTPDKEGLGIPKELTGINLTRRRKRCAVCKQIFYTVEIDERDYLFLRQKTGRLESPQPMIHRRFGGGS